MRWVGCGVAGPGAYDGRGQTRGDGSNWNVAGRDKLRCKRQRNLNVIFFAIQTLTQTYTWVTLACFSVNQHIHVTNEQYNF